MEKLQNSAATVALAGILAACDASPAEQPKTEKKGSPAHQASQPKRDPKVIEVQPPHADPPLLEVGTVFTGPTDYVLEEMMGRLEQELDCNTGIEKTFFDIDPLIDAEVDERIMKARIRTDMLLNAMQQTTGLKITDFRVDPTQDFAVYDATRKAVLRFDVQVDDVDSGVAGTIEGLCVPNTFSENVLGREFNIHTIGTMQPDRKTIYADGLVNLFTELDSDSSPRAKDRR